MTYLFYLDPHPDLIGIRTCRQQFLRGDSWLQEQQEQAKALYEVQGVAGVKRLVMRENREEVMRAASAWYVVGCHPDWQPQEGAGRLHGFPWMIADVLRELRQHVGGA
jgi:hypothetical protein